MSSNNSGTTVTRFAGFKAMGWPLGIHSERIVVALVRVDAGVPADMEELAAFVDGGGNGTFGYRINIVGAGDDEWGIPKIKSRPNGSKYIESKLSFSSPDKDKERTRYYEVAVFRD